jgi:hypothetical protein
VEIESGKQEIRKGEMGGGMMLGTPAGPDIMGFRGNDYDGRGRNEKEAEGG